MGRVGLRFDKSVEVAAVDVHVRAAVVERCLVEDGDAFATLVVDDARPHVVTATLLLPAVGQLGLLEHGVAADHFAELEAEGDVVFLLAAVEVGRQDFALDELALAGGFLFEDEIGRVASAHLRVEGAEMIHQGVGGGVQGRTHGKSLSCQAKHCCRIANISQFL